MGYLKVVGPNIFLVDHKREEVLGVINESHGYYFFIPLSGNGVSRFEKYGNPLTLQNACMEALKYNPSG